MRRSSGRQQLAFARSPRDRSRSGGAARAGRTLVFLAVVAALAAVVVFLVWGGGGTPTAQLAQPVTVVGKKTPVAIALQAGRPGLRSYEVRLETAAGVHPIASEEIPRAGFFGSDVREKKLDLTIDAASPSGATRGSSSSRTTTPRSAGCARARRCSPSRCAST